MKVYIIDPEITMSDSKNANVFNELLQQQLQLYAIDFSIVNRLNIGKCKAKINKNAMVIFFNDDIEKVDHQSSIYLFLCEAKAKGSLIWPVAMDRNKRIPPEIISDKQSFDVWEQFRCRNLNEEYLSVIANAFARKVISRTMPTLYSESGLIFISHRRIDGEEITAKLCDKFLIQSKANKTFRDVTEVEVGEAAQEEIDEAMSRSDAFIFIHTKKSAESEWIMKELRYAILRNIPIVWVNIDNAAVKELKLKPTENPHLQYTSDSFDKEELLTKIVDEILQKAYELIMSRSNKLFDYYNNINETFKGAITEVDGNKMLYSLDVKRKGYRYPQRNINQYIQLFGRTPVEEDKKEYLNFLNGQKSEYDSAVILTDRIVKSEVNDDIIIEPYDDFFYHWNKYLGKTDDNKNKEIIISGAFPDSDEVYKQTLTDALVIFAKSILKSGYTLTFGSHPTFQELFFEVAREACPEDYNKKLKMYISKWFDYSDYRNYYLSNSIVFETEKSNTLEESLTSMRKAMIQRKEIAALVCLGGKVKKNKTEEGIREEISLARTANIPVFIVGSAGGCSSVVAAEYKKNNWQELNDASFELNNDFAESLDYFTLSKKMLNHLNMNKEMR